MNQRKEFNLDVQIQLIKQQVQNIDKYPIQNNSNILQICLQNYNKNDLIIKSLVNFMIYQQNWNHRYQLQLDKSRQSNLKYLQKQITDTKEILIGKMQLFDTLDQKIEKKNRQLQQRINERIIKSTAKYYLLQSKLQELQQQLKDITKKIKNLDRTMQNWNFRSILPQTSKKREKQFSMTKKKVDQCSQIYLHRNILTSHQDNYEVLDHNFLWNYSQSSIKISKMTGQIRFGMLSCQKDKNSRYIFYSSFGKIFDNFNKYSPLIILTQCKEGDILQLFANTFVGVFTWKIKNLNKEQTKTIKCKQISRMWRFFIFFQKEGDSVIMLK